MTQNVNLISKIKNKIAAPTPTRAPRFSINPIGYINQNSFGS